MLHTRTTDEWTKNIILIKGLQESFKKDIHADILLEELNQYTKLILITRNITYFDKGKEEKYLWPYGGVEKGSSIIVYGAGNVGQSICHYLSSIEGIKVIDWLDREYLKYQKLGLKVCSPEK